MPAFPGTVRVAGTLSATDGAVIVTDDRLSLQAGEDNLGNWSLDTLDVAHKGRAITIAIDSEVVVFMTDDADQLVEAVVEGAKRAAETAAIRNDQIKRTKRPRIGRKATAKRKIEMFEEHQRAEAAAALPAGAAVEPGADPWLQQITVDAPLLTLDDIATEPPVAPEPEATREPEPEATREELTEELAALTQTASIPEPAPAPEPLPDIILEETPDHGEDEPAAAPEVRRRLAPPRLRPSLLVAIAAVAAIVAVGVIFTEAVSLATLGIAAVAIMVAIAGIMDQTIELRLPKQLSVTRLFGLGLALLAAATALNALT